MRSCILHVAAGNEAGVLWRELALVFDIDTA
jgi:hypothetical protein